MDYLGEDVEAVVLAKQDIVCVRRADCSSLDIVLVLRRKSHDAVAGCECFQQRSLHRLNCRIDILADILRITLVMRFGQLRVVVIQNLLTLA